MNEYFKTNQQLWDDITGIHVQSQFYDVTGFKKGRCSLQAVEVAEVGDVTGKSLLHLQCHFGQDTLSWARRGANVMGIDFSQKGIGQAKLLAEELNIPAAFLCCNLFDLPEHLDSTFDIVYTSVGVLLWLDDLGRWAQIISHFLKPGGIFYIHEFHPTLWMFDDEGDIKQPTLRYPYFKSNEPMYLESEGDYADPDATINSSSYEWSHGLGEIVTALINAGLQIEFLHEFNSCCIQALPCLTQGEDGLWRYDGLPGGLPLAFSIKAVKK